MNLDLAQFAAVLARDHFVTVCASCGAILRVQASAHHGLSHGVCDVCANRELRKHEQYKVLTGMVMEGSAMLVMKGLTV